MTMDVYRCQKQKYESWDMGNVLGRDYKGKIRQVQMGGQQGQKDRNREKWEDEEEKSV